MNFSDFKNYVYKNISRDSSDSLAALIVPQAINFAIPLCAINYRPVELEAKQSVTILLSYTYVDFSTYDYLDIIKIYNSTDSKDMHFIPNELLGVLSSTIGSPRFWSAFGRNIYTKPTHTADTVLDVYYLKYPALLVNDTDSPEFSHHDSQIVSVASAIAFATLEEQEASTLWMQLSAILGASFSREMISKLMVGGRPGILEPVQTIQSNQQGSNQ